MNEKPEDDEKKVSLDNFIPPSKESNKNTDEATIFMKERQEKTSKISQDRFKHPKKNRKNKSNRGIDRISEKQHSQ